MLKTILDFILNEQRLNCFFFSLLWLGPLLGFIYGIITGLLRKRLAQKLLKGIGLGLLTTFVSLMWYLYNAIMNHYGLDSVKGLLINLALFSIIGISFGLFCRLGLYKRNNRES